MEESPLHNYYNECKYLIQCLKPRNDSKMVAFTIIINVGGPRLQVASNDSLFGNCTLV